MSDEESNLLFSEMSIKELTETVDEMSKQLMEAKAALRNMRLSGVRSAIEARKLADVDLVDELKKLGISNVLPSGPFRTPYFKWY